MKQRNKSFAVQSAIVCACVREACFKRENKKATSIKMQICGKCFSWQLGATKNTLAIVSMNAVAVWKHFKVFVGIYK